MTPLLVASALRPTAPVERTVVMGILNVTPDSFSDGRPSQTVSEAVARGIRMRDQGADVVDVGGESTRPGAPRVSPDEELRRVLPVVAGLVEAGVRVSIDTTRRSVAEQSVRAGASVVNDVSGGEADHELPAFMADAGLPYIVMHRRGPSADMASRAVYHDVVDDVVGELRLCVDAVVDAGVRPEQIIVDPGLGFAKTALHDWRLLAHRGALDRLGLPLLFGASRKSFLGSFPVGPHRARRDVTSRDGLTAALTAILAAGGAWGVRVHDVERSVEAVEVAAALRAAAQPDGWPQNPRLEVAG